MQEPIMLAVNPYLTFPGTTEQAFAFYRSVFGGDFAALMRFGESPMGGQVPASEKTKIMHVSLPLPGGGVLMGSDSCEGFGPKLSVGNNFTISITTESEAETTKLFTALSAGGQVGMPPQKTFWGAFFGMCTDRFGVQWMVSYTYPKGG
jgi:PhnB protein